MFLLKGKLENQNKIIVDTIYNLNVQENEEIDTSDGVIVEEYLMSPLTIGIQPKRGKSYMLCINPQTKEQWFEEVDRPLTQEEQVEILNEKLDLIIMSQLEMEGIL